MVKPWIADQCVNRLEKIIGKLDKLTVKGDVLEGCYNAASEALEAMQEEYARVRDMQSEAVEAE